MDKKTVEKVTFVCQIIETVVKCFAGCIVTTAHALHAIDQILYNL